MMKRESAAKKSGKMPSELLERFKGKKDDGEVKAAVMPSSKGKRAKRAKEAMGRGMKRLSRAAELRAAGKTEKAERRQAKGEKAMSKAAKLSQPKKTAKPKGRATGPGPKPSDVRSTPRRRTGILSGTEPTPYRGAAPENSGTMKPKKYKSAISGGSGGNGTYSKPAPKKTASKRSAPTRSAPKRAAKRKARRASKRG